ncbi:MAG: carbonic anhydrase [Candidatus Eremiobacteraeota bacterium]|nr:carbonic anhydrase [Candidatus Eremiobacteraeota bacterium]
MSFDQRRFSAGAIDAGRPATPHASLERLLAGNERFASDRAISPHSTARRIELAAGQSPFAIVLGCSDSRVPVETVFDQPPGSIFVVRIAGNFVEENGLGSIEFSVAALKSSLILVLGHSNCGAVTAAVDYVRDGAEQPGHIQTLVRAVEPSARAARSQTGDWLHNATLRNVRDSMAALASRSKIVADAVASGSLAISGGIYDLHSGTVTIIT